MTPRACTGFYSQKLFDRTLYLCLYSAHPPHSEGVLMRRQEGGGGCGARGRGNVPPHPGGAGAPPGTTTGPCQELADGGPPQSARGCERAIDPKGVARSQAGGGTKRSVGKARPGAGRRTPLWRAERRRTFARRCARKNGCARRRAIPSLSRGQRKDRPTPGLDKEQGRRSIG